MSTTTWDNASTAFASPGWSSASSTNRGAKAQPGQSRYRAPRRLGGVAVAGAVELLLPRLHRRLELRGERLILLPGRPTRLLPGRHRRHQHHHPQDQATHRTESPSRVCHASSRSSRDPTTIVRSAARRLGREAGVRGLFAGASERAVRKVGPGFRSLTPIASRARRRSQAGKSDLRRCRHEIIIPLGTGSECGGSGQV